MLFPVLLLLATLSRASLLDWADLSNVSSPETARHELESLIEPNTVVPAAVISPDSSPDQYPTPAPPYSTSTSTSTSTPPPTSTPPVPGTCLIEGQSKYVGWNVAESRPGSCNVDVQVTAEKGSGDLWRFKQTVNGTSGYLTYNPENLSCGTLGQMRNVVGGTSTQWQIDCSTNHMAPVYNGQLMPPSIGVALGPALLSVSSESEETLDCYRKSLSLPTYSDLFFTFLDQAANQCSASA